MTFDEDNPKRFLEAMEKRPLFDFLKSHISKKKVKVSYEEPDGVKNYLAEEFTLIYDRGRDKLFISLPNSKKREEVT